MLDIHCHILPGVDDGAQNEAESLAMLAAAAAAGIDQIVCTPHYKHSSFDPDEIFDAFDWFEEQAYNKGIEAILGYEIHWRKIEQYGIDDVLEHVIEGSTYALVEFYANHSIGQLEQRALWKLRGKGVTPIIAHPERYASIQRNLELADELKDAGCLLQMSADAIKAQMFTPARKAVKYMTKHNLYDFVASDAHCPDDYEYFIKAVKEMPSIVAKQEHFSL